MEEPTYAEIKKALYLVQNKIFFAGEEGEKTLLFVYYAGHGIQANMTEIITNGGSKFKYPLEKMLRCFGSIKGAFVFSLFDCCRERVNAELEKKFRGLRTPAGDDEVALSGIENIIGDPEGPTRGMNL